jgi:hypothetical protein
MELTYKFPSDQYLQAALNFIHNFSPRKSEKNLIVDFDLEEIWTPLKEVWVSTDFRKRAIRFYGECDEAVRALYHDCTMYLKDKFINSTGEVETG